MTLQLCAWLLGETNDFMHLQRETAFGVTFQVTSPAFPTSSHHLYYPIFFQNFQIVFKTAQIAMSDDEMQDAPQEQYIGTQYPFEHDDDTDKFPSRPRNDKETLYFHQLYMELFEPLLQNRKKATLARNTRGLKPHEIRRQIIDRFIHRWRTEVGPDIYPAFRLSGCLKSPLTKFALLIVM